MISNEEINSIVESIVKIARPQRVYLFGSYAQGRYREDRDLDIAVVMPQIHDCLNEIVKIKKLLGSKEYSIDLLLFSHEDFYIESPLRIIREIRDTGKWLYAA